MVISSSDKDRRCGDIVIVDSRACCLFVSLRCQIHEEVSSRLIRSLCESSILQASIFVPLRILVFRIKYGKFVWKCDDAHSHVRRIQEKRKIVFDPHAFAIIRESDPVLCFCRLQLFTMYVYTRKDDDFERRCNSVGGF